MSKNNNNATIPIALAMPPPPTEESMQQESTQNFEFEEPMTPTTRADTESRMAMEDANITEDPQEEKKYHFQDKVIVNGETIFEISDDKVFYEEEKVRRNTRWTDPVSRKSKFPIST